MRVDSRSMVKTWRGWRGWGSGKERETGSKAQTSHSGCKEAPLGSENPGRGEESEETLLPLPSARTC